MTFLLRSYYQLKLLVGATLEGLAEKDLQRQCHTEGTNMVVGLLLSIQTIDFWRAGHSLSPSQMALLRHWLLDLEGLGLVSVP